MEKVPWTFDLMENLLIDENCNPQKLDTWILDNYLVFQRIQKQKELAENFWCRKLQRFNDNILKGKDSFLINEKIYGYQKEILCVLSHHAKTEIWSAHNLVNKPDFCKLYNIIVDKDENQEYFTCCESTYYSLYILNQEGNLQIMKWEKWLTTFVTSKKELWNEKYLAKDLLNFVWVLFPFKQEYP